jgi:hypothetical protein
MEDPDRGDGLVVAVALQPEGGKAKASAQQNEAPARELRRSWSSGAPSAPSRTGILAFRRCCLASGTQQVPVKDEASTGVGAAVADRLERCSLTGIAEAITDRTSSATPGSWV